MIFVKRFEKLQPAKNYIGNVVRLCDNRDLNPVYNAGGDRSHHRVVNWDWQSVGYLFRSIEEHLKIDDTKNEVFNVNCYDFKVRVCYTDKIFFVIIDFWRVVYNENVIIADCADSICAYLQYSNAIPTYLVNQICTNVREFMPMRMIPDKKIKQAISLTENPGISYKLTCASYNNPNIIVGGIYSGNLVNILAPNRNGYFIMEIYKGIVNLTTGHTAVEDADYTFVDINGNPI